MKNPPFSNSQIYLANNINLIEFAKSQGYILENGGRRALHAKQSGGLYFFRDSKKFYHFQPTPTLVPGSGPGTSLLGISRHLGDHFLLGQRC